MFRAVDSSRGAVEATVEPHAVKVVKPAVAWSAHVTRLAADGGFTAFEAAWLARIQAAGSYPLRNALLLMFAALVDGCVMAMHWSRCGPDGGRLGKANGGG
jgi:hypothetical protein